MIIADPRLVYLVSLIGTVKTSLFIAIVFLICILVAFLFGWESNRGERYFNTLKKIAAGLFTSLFLFIILPDKVTIVNMIIAKHMADGKNPQIDTLEIKKIYSDYNF